MAILGSRSLVWLNVLRRPLLPEFGLRGAVDKIG
jgi:hypothetical protein